MKRKFCTYLLFIIIQSLFAQEVIDQYGVKIRSDTSAPLIYLCFTGHDYTDGFDHVLEVLEEHNIVASFFLTGDFIRNHTDIVKKIINYDHLIGPHSDRHLLYCAWTNRDSLLHSISTIEQDILKNINELNNVGINSQYFMPPYEWYNQEVVDIASALHLTTVNFTPGTRSNADYTSHDMANYISSQEIMNSIYQYENDNGMNGFQLLIHPGTTSLRKDKFYLRLNELIAFFTENGYRFAKFDKR